MKLFFSSRFSLSDRNFALLWGSITLLLLTVILSFSARAISASSDQRLLPIYCVSREDPSISLTFDGAWGNEDLNDILSILAAHNVQATFFLTGEWIRKFPSDVKNIIAAGHDVGSHGDTHKDMIFLGKEEMKKELEGASQALFDLTGIRMDLFRPPYGSYNNTLIQTAQEQGYYSIQWSVDSLDWRNYGTQDILNRVLNHKALENGAIILLHNGARYTSSALDSLLTGLEEQGYKMIPVSQLIYRDHYYLEHDGTQVLAP